MNALTLLALALLLVFVLIPNRYLNSGHWGGALLLYAFVEGARTTVWTRAISFWLALFCGVGLVVYWLLARLKKVDDDAKQRKEETEESADR